MSKTHVAQESFFGKWFPKANFPMCWTHFQSLAVKNQLSKSFQIIFKTIAYNHHFENFHVQLSSPSAFN